MQTSRPRPWLLVVAAIVAACSSDGGTDPIVVANIQIGAAPRAIEVGSSVQLSATATDASGNAVASPGLSWTTSDAAVASVSASGLVTGTGPGTATIAAAADGASASVDIAVRETGPLPNELSGVLRRLRFSVESGAQHTVTADLVVFADVEIRIDGTLRVAPGASLSLISDSAITINGTIQTIAAMPGSGRRTPDRPGSAAPGGLRGISALMGTTAATARFHGNDVLVSAPDIAIGTFLGTNPSSISGEGHVVIAGGGPNFQGQRSLTVGEFGAIRAGNGEDAKNASEEGGRGHFVFIGTPLALQSAADVTKQQAFGFNSVFITGGGPGGPGIVAGHAGTGFSIETFAAADDQGATVTATATDGGKGGNIEIQAAQSISLFSFVTAIGGSGGNGGSVGKPDGSAPFVVPDGIFDILKGKSLVAKTGNGGDGGDVILAAASVTGDSFQAQGGEGGGITVTGGNGDAGASGGDFTITVGRPGAFGQGTTLLGGLHQEPRFVVSDAMNGGDANNPLLNGGLGGRLAVTREAIPAGVNEANRSTNAMSRISSGGAGFNGCKVNPQVAGTNGGAAGRLLVPAGLAGAPTDSHKGGKGGDGTTPGTGGDPGMDETTGMPIGMMGAPGAICAALVDAVRLDHALGPNFPAGTIVELSRITGSYSRIGPEAGCPDEHLHGTIFIDGLGPFGDPNPPGCGFGPIIQVEGSEARR